MVDLVEWQEEALGQLEEVLEELEVVPEELEEVLEERAWHLGLVGLAEWEQEPLNLEKVSC